MARKRKRRRSTTKKPVETRPGTLENPLSQREIIVPVIVDIVKMYTMIGMFIIVFILWNIHVFPELFWGSLKETSVLLEIGYASIIAYFGWLTYKPMDEIYKLSRAVPIERIDFNYVAPRRNRMLIFGTIFSVLYLLPVLYINGVITKATSYINIYVIQNQRAAQVFAWLFTAAITGIIGNMATTILDRIAAAIFKRKEK
jgi:hypothetical protein